MYYGEFENSQLTCSNALRYRRLVGVKSLHLVHVTKILLLLLRYKLNCIYVAFDNVYATWNA